MSRRGGRGAKSPWQPALLWLALALAIVATIYWMQGWSHAPSGSGESVAGLADRPPAEQASAGAYAGGGERAASDSLGVGAEGAVDATEPEVSAGPATSADPPVARGDGVLLSIVIDDLGRSLQDVRDLHQLDAEIAFAVLPFESKTSEVTALLNSLDVETLLHLPMQAKGPQDPGLGALLTSMSVTEVVEATRRALRAVPGIVGVNNHMGSAFTEDRARMEAVLGVVAEKDLFFLDSRTSPESWGFRLARLADVHAAERTVFLDNDPSEAAITEQFERLLNEGRRQGSAIAIGHPYASTKRVLQRQIARARALGYEFVPISALLERSSSQF